MLQNVRFGAAVLFAGSLLAPAGESLAQGRLDARYGISMAGIAIGKAAWTLETDGGRYVTAATGSASGLLSVLFDGEGRASTRGTLEHGRPVPDHFAAQNVGEGDRTEVRMRFEDGSVADLRVVGAPPVADRVPLMPGDRLGVLDPLSALLLPIAGAFDVLSPEICQRTLPVFDGRRRYDLRLSFKRMEHVKSAGGYSGAAIVCAMTFKAHAGHSAGSLLVKYLSEGRDMELWLAPVAGTRVVAPLRAQVAGLLGNLVVQATRFDMPARATASAHGIGRLP